MIGKYVVMACYNELFQLSLGKNEEDHKNSVTLAGDSTII
jgi:hypothetical protein